MKYLVDDQFDNMGVAITNNGEDIDLDVINTNQKISKPATFMPLQPTPDHNQAINDENKKKIE